MINISWIRWHIYNFVVCKYNDNKQSESESDLKIPKAHSDHPSPVRIYLFWSSI